MFAHVTLFIFWSSKIKKKFQEKCRKQELEREKDRCISKLENELTQKTLVSERLESKLNLVSANLFTDFFTISHYF